MSGPCFSSSVVGHPLEPTKDHRLGKRLFYQQPNPTRTHLKAALNLFFNINKLTKKQATKGCIKTLK
jgi:hypothetical protein